MSHAPRRPDPDHVRAELERLRIRSQQDLHRLWELLMSPLGFSSRSLWVTFVDPDGRPVPQLMEIGELPSGAAAREAEALVGMLARTFGDAREEVAVAFLVVRPGRSGLHDDDRRLAAALLAAARGAGLPCHPVHVADDVRLQVVTPDDLAA